jgi:MFS family permease
MARAGTRPRRGGQWKACAMARTQSPATAAAAPAAARPSATARFQTAVGALRLRDFRLLFFGTVAQGFGQWAQTIGMGWLVYELTGESAVQLGLISAFSGIVRLLAGPFIGFALDRYSRRDILIWSTALGAAQGGALALLVVSGYAEVWHVYLFALAEGLVTTTNQTTRQAYVYDITTNETLPNAVALNSVGQNLSRVSGPPLVGVLAVFDIAAPFIFLTVMKTIGVLLTLPLSRATRQAGRAAEHPLRGTWQGLHYVAREPAVLGLVVLALIPAFLVYPYVQLLPVFAKQVLGGGAFEFGLLAASIGWGSLAGLLGLAFAGDPPHKGRIALWGMLGYAVLLLGFSQSTVLWLSLALLTGAGVFHGVSLALQQTLVQLLARNDMRGRATSVFQMGFALQPLGVLLMALAIDRWGAGRAVGSFFAVSSLAFAWMAVSWRSLRRV